MFIVDAADNKPEQNQSCSFLLLYSVKCQVYRQYVPPILLGGGKNGPRGHLRAQYLLLPLPVSIHLKDHTPRHDFSLPPSMNDSLVCLTVLRCIELVTLQPRNLRINLFFEEKNHLGESILWRTPLFVTFQLLFYSPFGSVNKKLLCPDLNGHCRTSTASSRSQCALPDLNRGWGPAVSAHVRENVRIDAR